MKQKGFSLIIVIIIIAIFVFVGLIISQRSNKSSQIVSQVAKTNVPFSCEYQAQKIADLRNKETPDEFITKSSDKELLYKWKEAILVKNDWTNEEFNNNVRFWGVNDSNIDGPKLFIGFNYIHDWVDVNANNYVDKQSGEPTIVFDFPKEKIISCEKALELVHNNDLPSKINNISFYSLGGKYNTYKLNINVSPNDTKRPCKRGTIDLVTGEVNVSESNLNCPVY